MRILHTSDWHLGKRLFKLDRTEEHEAFLSWLIVTLVDRKIDVLLIAGDIFDTPSPPHQSLELFYRFLHRLSTETTAQAFIIAGNHDSGVLLDAPALLLKQHRTHVWGKLSPDPKDHWISITCGEETLELCALPFFRSFELLPQGEGDIQEALKSYFARDSKYPKILMLHHLAGEFKAAGSEQVISLSGLESIPSILFENFDYVALGHIHKPQKAGPKAYYSGSPIPMRFSETNAKFVMELEIKEKKITSIERLPIPVSRKLTSFKVDEKNWKEEISKADFNSPLPAVVDIQITLDAPKIGLIDEIKKVLESKGADLLSYQPHYGEAKTEDLRHERIFELSHIDLFTEFYAAKYPEAPELPEELRKDFTELLDRAKHATT
jgi:DNA repair protein SbcD/Mre11